MRTIGFTALNAEGRAMLAPEIEVTCADRYLGRPVLHAAGAGDDGLNAGRVGLAYRSGELLQLKSNGAAIQFGARDATTLAVTLPWTTIATAAVSEYPVALIQSGADTLAIWIDSATTARYRRSVDGGRSWDGPAILHSAGAGNALYGLLPSSTGAVAVEERVPGGTAWLHTYSYGAGAYTLFDTHDTGGTRLWGGSIDPAAGVIVYAVDVQEATTSGAVTVGYVRLYDLGSGATRGSLHQGVLGGVVWRDPQHLQMAGYPAVVAVVQLPRGTGDTSDRVCLFPYDATRIGAHHPLGPPRAIYAVEDHEGIAVAAGGGALFIMAGSYVQRLVEGDGGNTGQSGAGTGQSGAGTEALPLQVDTLRLDYEPEDERLELTLRGGLSAGGVQLRCRMGYRGDFVEMGLWWAGPRVYGGRQGQAVAAYGLWGVLRRELQQLSCELSEVDGSPLAPGDILRLIFTGLGFGYSEDPSLAATLHPAPGARLRWALRYGQPYAELARSILRWCGCEARGGAAADGVTPTVMIVRPGSRFGPTPAVAKQIGGALHPALEVVGVDPERVSDVTLLPGGWDHQTTLDWVADRQLVLQASSAYGVQSTIEPATRALARALAGADAGYVRLRPALEVELWDTISITDTAAGFSSARRLVRSAAIDAGRGRWEMRLGLGLE